MTDHTDPRVPGGSIIGPGGPHDRHAVILDTDHAVLLDDLTVTQVETSGRDVILAMQLSGRINKTPDRATMLVLLSGDGAAALITELTALATRIGPEFASAFHDRLRHLEEQGALGTTNRP